MNKPKGFALLMSVMIMGTVLLLAALSASRWIMVELQRTTRMEDFLVAQLAAEGCADTALMRLWEDGGYVGGETLNLGAQQCTIRPVLSGASTVVETEATVNHQVYRLQITLSDLGPPLVISSWQRVISF